MSAVSSPERSARHRVATIVVTAAAGVVAVLAAVLAFLVYAHRPITAAGSVTITDNVVGGRTCLSSSEDDDLHKGAAVVIRAPSNQIIASGELDEGVGAHPIAGYAQTCRFGFSVSGVPRERFYRIAVGGLPPVVFTYRQVAGHKVTLPTR